MECSAVAYVKQVRFTDATKSSVESCQVLLTIETDNPTGLSDAQSIVGLVGRWVEVEFSQHVSADHPHQEDFTDDDVDRV